MEKFIKVESYQTKLGILETQKAIKLVKDYFETELAKELSLTRVSAPLFVRPETGLNDNLNGWEDAVSFSTYFAPSLQVVHSLAKWKRTALRDYGITQGYGLYADMNAIRACEDLSNVHSLYVDQWDWEKHIAKSQRTDAYLEETVNSIFNALKSTERYINDIYPSLLPKLPDKITFLTSQDVLDKYPDLDDKGRETAIVKEYGAVFLKQIGGELSNGKPHDGRAADYDDWSLNGDILVYHKPLDTVLELSSMGIRVCEDSLIEQLTKANQLERLELDYHKGIINKELPYTVGGGIGQSRLCMFFLEKVHIGEVQASTWSPTMVENCKKHNISLL